MKDLNFAAQRILSLALIPIFILMSSLRAQEPTAKKEGIEKLQAYLAENPDDAVAQHDLGVLLDKAGQKDEALTHLEMAIQLDPGNIDYSNFYRMRIREYGHRYFDRSIQFFENMVREHPQMIELRLNKSLSYIDKIPYPKLGIVGQGILSNKSIAELDTILSIDPECWTALYARAMNHLHWPRMLRHAPLAIEDFKKLIAMQKSWGPKKQKPYFVLTYVALGDAYVKNRAVDWEGMFTKARATWREGLSVYPNDPELKKRLSLTDEELVKLIRKVRGLEDPIDTDLSILWRPWE